MTSHTDPTVKHDALLLFEAVDSNPNGDPDNAGKPRTDLDTGHGLVSDASLKRKVRDAVQFQVDQGLLTPADRYQIFIRRGVSLNEQLEAAYEALGQDKGKPKAASVAKGAAYMIANYYDVRMFGAVMSTGHASAGKVTGPVTVGLARSLDPVLPIDLGITRTASTKEADKDNASQMGNKSVIPYGLYVCRIHYQPTKDNQVTPEDLEVLWSTLSTMFEVTRSAARPDVSVRNLFVFSHSNALGDAPARKLLDTVSVTKVTDAEVPTSSSDYVIEPPADGALPKGISLVTVV
ncbi:type I-C CRISPR-associated protein Cas7/Csd2 [Nocardioides sp. L-11A]|uniref:type I-C CRISPR-associated protein Cas7/Csd2 n=1 Tax=Nocardioides sp. L-11A TaxID=3043848 RepID=UPI00249B26A4|nr:type I-C CRISPR-associated protein Cas7/Csd2 [Nocardioides sp. L-11A]